MSEKRKRGVVVSVRFTPSELDELQVYCREHGVSMSETLRIASLTAAETADPDWLQSWPSGVVARPGRDITVVGGSRSPDQARELAQALLEAAELAERPNQADAAYDGRVSA